jgi:NADPH:quinone reductase-like Zn-dependent oxidoreductase
MKALILEETGGTDRLVLKEAPMPEINEDSVLVQIHTTTIHPYDLAIISGAFGHKTDFVPGIEGAGVVVRTKNPEFRDLVGRRVACFNTGPGSTGVWAEFAAVNRGAVMPIDDDVDINQAAVLFNTPMSTRMIIDEVQAIHAPSVLINAAFSSIGKMLIQYFKIINIRTLAIVRKPEQVEKLYELGADKVLNSTDSDYDRQLQESILHFSIICALECVGGRDAEKIFSYLPDNSFIFRYGNLSPSAPHFNEEEVKGRGITIRFLALPVWLRGKSYEERYAVFHSNTHEYRAIFTPAVGAEMPLSRDAVEYAKQHSGSEGKVIMKADL